MKILYTILALCSALLSLAQDCDSFDDCYDKGYKGETWREQELYYTKAIELWDTDLQSEIYLADAYSGRAIANMHVSSLDNDEAVLERALKDGSKALSLNTKDWRAHYMRGYVHVLKESGWDSINFHFDRAVEADKGNAYSAYFLAQKYYGWNYYKKTKDFLDIAIGRLPDRSVSLDENGEKIFAMRIGDTSVPMDLRAEMYALRGKIQLDNFRDKEASYKDVIKAKELDPNNYKAISYLGKLLYDPNPEKSAEYYNELILKYPAKGEGYFWIAMNNYRNQNYSDALVGFISAAEREPKEWPDGWLWASTISNIQGRWDNCIKYSTKAINSCTYKPDIGQAYQNRGYAYWQKGMTDYTVSDFKKAVDNGNEQARTYLRDSFKIAY